MDCKHNHTSYSSGREIKCMECGKIIPPICGDDFMSMINKFEKDGGDVDWLIGNNKKK